MSSILYLSRAEVSALLPPATEQLDLVEETYRAVAAGRVELPPKPGVHPRPDAFIHAMPAYLEDGDIAALKWVSGYPENTSRGLPYISGLIVLNDADTGLPTAIMDGAEITAARTAAASGVCVRRWAPQGWTTAAIVGCGEQGRFHAALLRELNPGVRIRAYDPHPERIASLGDVEAAGSPAEAAEGAQVVITAAPIVNDPKPQIGLDALGDEWLVLPIDFDAMIEREVIEAATLVAADDVAQFEYYREQGHFTGWPSPSAPVGAALLRRDLPPKVACVNLGIGALDAAFAARVHDAARAAGAGLELTR